MSKQKVAVEVGQRWRWKNARMERPDSVVVAQEGEVVRGYPPKKMPRWRLRPVDGTPDVLLADKTLRAEWRLVEGET